MWFKAWRHRYGEQWGERRGNELLGVGRILQLGICHNRTGIRGGVETSCETLQLTKLNDVESGLTFLTIFELFSTKLKIITEKHHDPGGTGMGNS